jgi:hypothetical protein
VVDGEFSDHQNGSPERQINFTIPKEKEVNTVLMYGLLSVSL